MKRAKVLGVFEDFDDFLGALRELRGMNIERIRTYTPVPCQDVDDVLGEKTSPIRYFTLAGGLLGFAAGAALTVYCAVAWKLLVGGKPIISVPPYLIIAFEMTILFSAILSTIGYFLLSPFPWARISHAYDPSFSSDKFGIFIESSKEDVPHMKAVMERNGATGTKVE